MKVSIPGFENQIEVQREKIKQLSKQLEFRVLTLTEPYRQWELRMEDFLRPPNANSLWIIPRPGSVHSTGKMEFETLPDGSILVKGENPLNDVQTIEFPWESGDLESIRLEVMRHPSLTDDGFARSYDGTFVLSGFELELNRTGVEAQKIGIAKVVADSERNAWPIQATVDKVSTPVGRLIQKVHAMRIMPYSFWINASQVKLARL